jgi:membrane protease YdiL (CAAX protease family)
MSSKTRTALLVLLPIHALALPLLAQLALPLTDAQLRLVHIAVSFALVLLLAWRYLRSELDALLDRKLFAALTLVRGYFFYFALTYLMMFLMLLISPGGVDLEALAGESAVGLTLAEARQILGMSAFLEPVAEEVLYRGAVFGALREKNRAAAYAVSIAVFFLCSILPLLLTGPDAYTLTLYAIEFIPVGFVLCWCYDVSGSLWVSILFRFILSVQALHLLF